MNVIASKAVYLTLKPELLLQDNQLVGNTIPRVDSALKVTGKAVYSRDLILPNVLYAKIKRSPHQHAKIINVDTQEALNIIGVKAIITGKDFPPPPTEDTPALASEEALYFNQGVVAVAAVDRRTAEEAAESVSVEYEELPYVTDPNLAKSRDCQVEFVHPGLIRRERNVGRHIKLRTGDVDKAFSESHIVIQNTYETAAETHFQLEPLTFLASPDPDGGVTVYGTSPGAQKLQFELATYLGLEPYLVRTRIPFLGGWFGGKEEAHVAAVCAKLALRSHRPVKLELSREETITATGVRHPAKIFIKDGVAKGGKILAREIEAVYDGGAYGSVGNGVMKNSLLSAVTVYKIPNFKFDSYRVFTNRVPGVMKRAPISTQMTFAIECQMDRIADKLKIDPVQLRLRNILHDGDQTAIGEQMEGLSYEKCINEVTKRMGLGYAGGKTFAEDSPWKRGFGIAIAAKHSAGGTQQAMVRLRENGKVEVWANIIENGQGIFTTITQIVADEFGIKPDNVVIMQLVHSVADSELAPLAPGAFASRQLVNMGNAIILACQDAKEKILSQASLKLAADPSDMEIRSGKARVKSQPDKAIDFSELFTRSPFRDSKNIMGYYYEQGYLQGFGTSHKKVGELDPETGLAVNGRVSPYYVSVAQTVDLSVNVETGRVKVHRIVAAMDVGKAINPGIVRDQIVGSVAMALNSTLTEELLIEGGKVTNANLADYRLLTASDVPFIEAVIVETPYSHGPYGARGAGEASVLATPAAVRNAIHDATGAWIDKLPITPESVLQALETT